MLKRRWEVSTVVFFHLSNEFICIMKFVLMEKATEVIFQFVKNIHSGQVLVFDMRKNAKLNRLTGAVKIMNILFWMIKQYVYKNADEWLNEYQFRNSFLTEGNKTFESVKFCYLRKVSINSMSSKRCRRILTCALIELI